MHAGIAQLVEHPTCNRTVVGSSPTASNLTPWGCRIAAIARDCKSLDSRLRWFESNRPQSTHFQQLTVTYRSKANSESSFLSNPCPTFLSYKKETSNRKNKR